MCGVISGGFPLLFVFLVVTSKCFFSFDVDGKITRVVVVVLQRSCCNKSSAAVERQERRRKWRKERK